MWRVGNGEFPRQLVLIEDRVVLAVSPGVFGVPETLAPMAPLLIPHNQTGHSNLIAFTGPPRAFALPGARIVTAQQGDDSVLASMARQNVNRVCNSMRRLFALSVNRPPDPAG